MIDVAALRREALEKFKDDAKRTFERHPKAQSLMLAVSQYFADEAGDAVHTLVVAYPARDPWPHRCDYEEPPTDGSWCERCSELAYDDPNQLPGGLLDSNMTAVFGWSAFCAEYGGGEGESLLVSPVAIARRGADGEVDLELVFELVRPWADRNDVALHREERRWSDDEESQPAPEPVRPPWTDAERALLGTILQRPADDGPRQVLIDHWLERQDVRGEFGSLSFAAPSRRRDELAAEHGRTWLGPLQPVVSIAGATFGRGPFPASVVFYAPSDEALAQTASVDEWALVDTIRFTGTRRAFNANMRGLTTAFGVDRAALASLERSRLVASIHTLGLSEVPSDVPASLRSVKTLILPANVPFSHFTQLALLQTIERLEVWLEHDWNDLPPWDDAVTQVLRTFAPLLSRSATLTVGYELHNGKHVGPVVVMNVGAGSLIVESRDFAQPASLQAANARIGKGTFVPQPRPTPNVVAPEPVSRLRQFLKRFGL